MAEKKIPIVKMIDFKLNNIKDFVIDDHPIINPCSDAKRYDNYWEDILSKCMTGMWGHDYNHKTSTGGYRFMTNHLYHFRNIFKLEVGENQMASPFLRDVDWWIKYAYADMEGFSGYEKDSQITSYRIIDKIEKQIPLLKVEEIFLKRHDSVLKDSNNKYKKYLDPKKNLARVHEKPMGEALYMNDNKNLGIISTRGIGKSYWSISRIQNGIMTNGAKNLKEYYSRKTKFIAIMGGYGEGATKENLRKFSASYSELQKLGSFKRGKCREEGVFWIPLKGSTALNGALTNGHLAPGGKELVGSGSILGRVTYELDENAGVGYRANYYHGEEWGLWKNPVGVHGANEPAQTRDTKFGSSCYNGTGGKMKKAINVLPIFRNPDMINGIHFEDHCTGSNKGICGFIPEYYRSEDYRPDPSTGNTDVESAYADALITREKARNTSQKTYIKWISGYPMVHNDAFMQTASEDLPVDRSAEKLSKIQSTPFYKRDLKVGHIIWTDPSKNDGVTFIEDKYATVIHNLEQVKEFTGKDKESAFIIYEEPEQIEEGKYICVYDSVSHKKGTSVCYANVFKFYGSKGKMFFNIVAEKVYRMKNQDLNDEEAIKLAVMYNADFYPEMNVENILNNIEKFPRGYRLGPVPLEAIRTIALQNPKHDFGVSISPTMKPGLLTLSGEILCLPVSSYIDHESIKHETWLIDTIPSEIFHETVQVYSLDGNYDVMSGWYIDSLVIRQRMLLGTIEKRQEARNSSKYKNFMYRLSNKSIQQKNSAYHV